jgi:prepilin-type N-terminal cleavage/methylation domain-containing protein
MKKILKSGFTLIELLVVISIIGILAALSLASFSTAQKQAKDTQRKSDLNQYQNSLELFANKNGGLYPQLTTSGGGLLSTVCGYLSLSGCPTDPVNSGSNVYKYQSDGTLSSGSIDATKYVLWDKLENTGTYWVVCSNGKSGTQASAPSPTAGGCPLP